MLDRTKRRDRNTSKEIAIERKNEENLINK